MYEDCALKHDIDNFLGTYGFCCEEVGDLEFDAWGDALYIKQ